MPRVLWNCSPLPEAQGVLPPYASLQKLWEITCKAVWKKIIELSLVYHNFPLTNAFYRKAPEKEGEGILQCYLEQKEKHK